MMGDSRVTRWSSTISEVEYNDEQIWHLLIEFLEHNLKVQQQKLLIRTKSRNKHMKKKGMLEYITAISLAISSI